MTSRVLEWHTYCKWHRILFFILSEYYLTLWLKFWFSTVILGDAWCSKQVLLCECASCFTALKCVSSPPKYTFKSRAAPGGLGEPQFKHQNIPSPINDDCSPDIFAQSLFSVSLTISNWKTVKWEKLEKLREIWFVRCKVKSRMNHMRIIPYFYILHTLPWTSAVLGG